MGALARVSIVAAFVLGAAWASATETTPPSERRERPPSGELARPALTTPEFQYREDRAFPLYDLLRLPEFALHLMLTPTYPVVRWAEDVRLDNRVQDVVMNEERTSLLLPTMSLFSNDPLGIGLRYTHSDLLGGEERLLLSGKVKMNSDYALEASHAQPIVWMDGRVLTLFVLHELNHNERYFGLGESSSSRPRALGVRETRAAASLDLVGPETSLNAFSMRTTIGYYRRANFEGTDPSMPSVTEAEGPPPGFGQAHDFIEVSQAFFHDLRDAAGRTGNGTLLALDLHATTQLGGGSVPLSGARAAGSATYFLSLAPRHRVLVGHLGGAGVVPWSEGDQVPLQTLVSLGRSTYPRGYAPFRFRHDVAWWGSVEYRYPVFDLGLAGAGASSMVFVDVAQGAGRVDELFESELHYSYGFGLRAETMGALLVRFQVGFSPEGAELLLSLNEAYANE